MCGRGPEESTHFRLSQFDGTELDEFSGERSVDVVDLLLDDVLHRLK